MKKVSYSIQLKGNKYNYKEVLDLTLPGNPQSNGKIEKFWSSLDKHIEGDQWEDVYESIKKYIFDYNYKIPHTGLGIGKDGFISTPAELYYDDDLRAINMESTSILIDNKNSIPLSEFVKKKKRNQNSQSKLSPKHPNTFNFLSIESLLNK